MGSQGKVNLGLENRAAVMQPYLFPYIGYFQLIACSDSFVLFDNVNFIKKGWINRNRIIVDQQEKLFTIPLGKISQNKLISEFHIHDWEESRKSFLHLIEQGYRKAPFFEETWPVLTESLNISDDQLVAVIKNTLRVFCEYLNITTPIFVASEIQGISELKGEDKIIDILSHFEVKTYVNPPGGRELYSQEKFKENNLNLKFLKLPLAKEYSQLSNKFIPYLSIIDLVMNVDRNLLINMVRSYELED